MDLENEGPDINSFGEMLQRLARFQQNQAREKKTAAFALSQQQSDEWKAINTMFTDSARLERAAKARKELLFLQLEPQIVSSGHKDDKLMIEDDGIVYVVNCECSACREKREAK